MPFTTVAVIGIPTRPIWSLLCQKGFLYGSLVFLKSIIEKQSSHFTTIDSIVISWFTQIQGCLHQYTFRRLGHIELRLWRTSRPLCLPVIPLVAMANHNSYIWKVDLIVIWKTRKVRPLILICLGSSEAYTISVFISLITHLITPKLNQPAYTFN